MSSTDHDLILADNHVQLPLDGPEIMVDTNLDSNGTNELEVPAAGNGDDEPEVDPEEMCSICLQQVEDRTVIPKCSHEFCFECLLVWTGESRFII